MPTRRTLLLAAACLATATPLAAQSTPPRGSPLRADLMNALRPTVEAEIGGQIEFVIKELRVLNDWAYAFVTPQRPGGNAIDWRRTKFREDMEQGIMGSDVMALLRRQAGQWRIAEYVIGPSDVAWDDWMTTRKLPRRLFTD